MYFYVDPEYSDSVYLNMNYVVQAFASYFYKKKKINKSKPNKKVLKEFKRIHDIVFDYSNWDDWNNSNMALTTAAEL